jgi:hypothetical protein
MSRAMANARQRRAGLSAPEPAVATKPVGSNTGSAGGGLTLQQVVALIDTRLTRLEKFQKDAQGPSGVEKSVQFVNSEETPSNLSQVLDDFNARFMMLAEEIAQIKDVVMRLQSYTMDVNKMLLEERVNVLSDLGDEKTMFVMEDADLNGNEIDKFESASA